MRHFMLSSGPLSVRWSTLANGWVVEDAQADDPLIGTFSTIDAALAFLWDEPIRQADKLGMDFRMAMIVEENPVEN